MVDKDVLSTRDEAKKKISIANTGRIHTAESKKKNERS